MIIIGANMDKTPGIIPGCSNCVRQERMVYSACAKFNLYADIQKNTDMIEYPKYGLFVTTELVVNGIPLSQGKIPTEPTLEHWIAKANEQCNQ